MSRAFKLISALVFISLSSCYSAKTVIYDDTNDLAVIKQKLAAENPDPKGVLVIFDIDDTLLESNNFVGSSSWYEWQRGREVYDPEGHKVTIKDNEIYHCMFSTLGTLFDLGTNKLTQQDNPQLIKDIDGYDLMILTARTYNYRRATERELDINGLDFRKYHLMADKQALDFDLFDNKRTDRVTYQNGIVMSSGLNKGLVLKAILGKIKRSYKTIYFVDDSLKNIQFMKQEWENSDTSFNLFHYTGVDKTISTEDIDQSNKSKQLFDSFMKNAFADRYEAFITNKCR